MTYSERYALKEIVKFAKREFREKKPLSVRILRFKDKQVFSRGGPIPTITIKETQIPYYLVVVEFEDNYRIYNYTKTAILINGVNIEKTSEKMKQIEKSTKLEYNIVKK